MFRRTVYEESPRRTPARTKVISGAIVLALASMLVAAWVSASGSAGLGPLGAAFRDPGSSAALEIALPGQEPQQPAPPPQLPGTPIDQLDRRLATPAAPLITEDMVRERESRAAASAFPVSRTLELSSTMYCLRGEMRTGVRTRDGMAAGDPRVLPLGSVVRVTRPNGDLIGIFVIMDTGGAIKGNDIDLYVDSCAEARRWGRHPVVAEVLEIGKRS